MQPLSGASAAKSIDRSPLQRVIGAAWGPMLGIVIPVAAGWAIWPDVIAWVRANGLEPHAPDMSVLARLNLATLTHIVGASVSLILGAWVLARPKGTATHRLLGRVWAGAMTLTAMSSFFMHSFAPLLGTFGLIHILSVWTLVNLPKAVMAARRGDIERHLRIMRGLYLGLVIAGTLTFIPGRTLFHVFFN